MDKAAIKSPEKQSGEGDNGKQHLLTRNRVFKLSLSDPAQLFSHVH
jgi:hypothetical protein